MKIASYRGTDGSPRLGAVVGESTAARVVDLHSVTDGAVPVGDLLALLELGPAGLDLVRNVDLSGEGGAPLTNQTLLAPISRPPKFLAAAQNYQAHIDEIGVDRVDKSRTVPKLFMKPASAIVGPDEGIPAPAYSSTLDWEIELAVIVGRRCRNVTPDEAMAHVAGYTIVNDVTARTVDWGVDGRSATEEDLFFDWLAGKWGDGFAPMGPWMVTTDDVGDVQNLRLSLSVNGVTHQDDTTASMIFGVGELISFASRFMTLEAGDLIATGTPAGIGAATGAYLREGDVLEGIVEGIGRLRSKVLPPLDRQSIVEP